MRPNAVALLCSLALLAVACAPASAPTPVALTPRVTTPTATDPSTYTVKPGDTLSAIAATLGVPTQALIDANPTINPNVLQVGQALTVPGAAAVAATQTPQAAPLESPAAPAAPSTCDDVSAVARVRPSVVHIVAGNISGSGFALDSSSLVLTNNHVVGANRTVEVTTADGKSNTGTVVVTWPDQDLALIRISASLPAIVWGDDSALLQGQRLLALGYPLDLPGEPTLTSGTYSAHRVIDGESYVQTDASVNPGNSGGPLFDQCGNVVGIVTWKFTNAAGLNFAIAASEARNLTNSALAPSRPTLSTTTSSPGQQSPAQLPAAPDLTLATSPASSSDPSIKIVSVTPGETPTRGSVFEFHISTSNTGAKGGAGSISVSSPDATSLSATLDSCDMAAKTTGLPPGSSAATFGSGNTQSVGRTVTHDWLAEADLTTWLAGGKCSITVRAGVPDAGSVSFFLRIAVTAPNGLIKTWPYGPKSQADQQGYPATLWKVSTLTASAPVAQSSGPGVSGSPGCLQAIDGDWTFTDAIRYGNGAGQSYDFHVHLSRQGQTVSGTGDLSLSGQLSGCVLNATFGQGSASGQFQWTFAPDDSHFSGSYSSAWYGNSGDSTGIKAGR